MTSGNFGTVDVNFIWVAREDRQRRELRNVEELAESIQRIGLIHAPVIQQDGKLVAGERRFAAMQLLGWTRIPVQYSADDADEKVLYSIELEENIKRENITWQEEVLALERYHKFQVDENEGWSQKDTAAALGYSPIDVSRKLAVAEHMDNEVIATADRVSAAHNMVQRNAERKKSSALDAVSATVAQVVPDAEPEKKGRKKKEPEPPPIPLLNVSFHDWQPTYDGPKFNLIHCDFPYGINVADSPRMDAAISDHYEDTPEIFWQLLARLGLAMENVIAESAHLIFWHSMKMNQHGEVTTLLEEMGWKCNPFPLIWHKSDGSGIAPDPQRGPRQVYEAAIFASRGDRKITQEGCVANCFPYPGRRGDEVIHVSEKPQPMLNHFLRMVCDEYSYAFDPTCGSGNALKVAETLGATRVLGLEQDAEFHRIACDNWSKR